ncbi:hypothetical protein [Actinophytocola oryzae]|uniref:PE domain-containing protein n=1 Tax=Actinophytocola oryzae TaxID=502181 RepID=A0A4R7V9G2_9PSEU|nr:hypothetical protein [Actinophytocola oryzae]TDV45568.1 hypothetical protein CLV71_112240 [Actinophytocola oryzae]
MASRDEWFSTNISGDGSLTKSGAPRHLAGGFRVDPAAAPAVRAAFEEAILMLKKARRAMTDMQFLSGGSVNPVVDRYLSVLAEVGYGDRGSVTMAADSAAAEYQSVIDQLDRVMAGYQGSEDEAQSRTRRLRS